VGVFDHTTGSAAALPSLHPTRLAPASPCLMYTLIKPQVELTMASVFRHLPEEEAEARINVWRPIGAAVYDVPLALADGGKDTPSNLLPSTLRSPEQDGETYQMAYPSEYAWYYCEGWELWNGGGGHDDVLGFCAQGGQEHFYAAYGVCGLRRLNGHGRGTVSRCGRWCSIQC